MLSDQQADSLKRFTEQARVGFSEIINEPNAVQLSVPWAGSDPFFDVLQDVSVGPASGYLHSASADLFRTMPGDHPGSPTYWVGTVAATKSIALSTRLSGRSGV